MCLGTIKYKTYGALKNRSESELEEYNSGMKVSEIAKIHDRTNGAICARLKKHGLME